MLRFQAFQDSDSPDVKVRMSLRSLTLSDRSEGTSSTGSIPMASLAFTASCAVDPGSATRTEPSDHELFLVRTHFHFHSAVPHHLGWYNPKEPQVIKELIWCLCERHCRKSSPTYLNDIIRIRLREQHYRNSSIRTTQSESGLHTVSMLRATSGPREQCSIQCMSTDWN